MDPGTESPSPLEASLTLRPGTAGDESFLFGVYASTRREELDAAGWDEGARRMFLDMQFKAQRQGYRGAYPEADFSIVLRDSVPAGQIVVSRGELLIQLVDVALLPEHRGQGIGGVLLTRLLKEAAQANQRVRLMAVKGSRASRLYARMGFRKLEQGDLFDTWQWTPGAVSAARTDD